MTRKKIKTWASLSLSVFVIVLALIFFIYPSVMICAVMSDSRLRQTGESRFVPAWFKSASSRYSSWADHYLSTHYAESLHHDDVAATEWPMFGSAFFLVTAKDLHAQGKIDATQGAVRKAVDRAAKIIVSPSTATWVKTKWGEDYLESENVFYRMLLILGLTSYESITGDTQHHTLMSRQRETLADELLNTKLHMRDDYPGECYPTDVLWAVAAIQRAALLDNTNHNDLASGLIAVLDGPLQAGGELPAFTVNSRSGTIIQDPRGCGQSGMMQFVAELDPLTGSRWYQAYEDKFWKETRWVKGFTEHPRGSAQVLSDVDSGPVIAEFGSVASAFGIGAAKSVGRYDHAAPLTMQAIACSWPTPFGPLVPGTMGYLAANSWSLGEVALLFSMTRPTYTATTIPYKGFAPALVWIAMFLFAGIGLLLIWIEIRHCRRLARATRS